MLQRASVQTCLLTLHTGLLPASERAPLDAVDMLGGGSHSRDGSGVLLVASLQVRTCQENSDQKDKEKKRIRLLHYCRPQFFKAAEGTFSFLFSPSQSSCETNLFATGTSVPEGMSDLSCSLSPGELSTAVWAAVCPFWVFPSTFPTKMVRPVVEEIIKPQKQPRQ